MDSAAIAFWQRPDIAITIDYGQLAALGEIEAAQQICLEIGIQHDIVRVDCRSLGSGDMAGTAPAPEAPVSEWWPYRNQLIITLAAARANMLGANRLLVGSVATDAIHADGRTEFFGLISALTAMQEGGLVVEAPAIELTTQRLVTVSKIPRSILAWAHSCHTGPTACGNCRGCYKHRTVTNEIYGDAY